MNVFCLVQDSQDMNKAYAAMFAPFWNEIIKSLREEDFISNRSVEKNLLLYSVSKFLCTETGRLCNIQPTPLSVSFLLLQMSQRTYCVQSDWVDYAEYFFIRLCI
jgi:hypothetical protein